MMNIGVRNNIQLAGKNVTVIGAARSGVAAARLLARVGAKVFLSDKDTSASDSPDVSGLKRVGIDTEFGAHSDRIYDADIMVVSPGVHQDAEIVKIAKQNHIPVISEVELASWHTELPIVAVTGSNGKTTTASILADMFMHAGYSTFLAGNIGIPFSKIVLENIDRAPEDGIHVLEISSFQMEHVYHFRPKVAVLLNLTADHLDRYPSMQNYAETKMRIIERMAGEDRVVYNNDDPMLRRLTKEVANRIPFSLGHHSQAVFRMNEEKIYDESHEIVIYLKDMALPGRHNVANFLAAATASQIFGVPLDGIRHVMKTFRGVPHRLEHVRTLNDIKFYNDSKATNVGSVRVALDSFSQPIILILGGRDKGADFRELLPHATPHVQLAVVLGEAADRIEQALFPNIPCKRVETIESAVSLAYGEAKPESVVLLSPACASFDMFENYEERGDTFKQAVRNLRRPD